MSSLVIVKYNVLCENDFLRFTSSKDSGSKTQRLRVKERGKEHIKHPLYVHSNLVMQARLKESERQKGQPVTPVATM